MLLSDRRILEELAHGNVVIAPFDERQLGTNSYDCRLGDWYFQPDANVESVDFTDEQQARRFWGEPRRAVDGRIPIRPGTTILAHTIEVIGARNGFTTSMHARSSIGRASLSVCKCAGVGDVGYISRWTMEISNHSRSTIILPVGLRICQIKFEQVGPTRREYHGKYGQAREWSPSDMLPKLYDDWDTADLWRYREVADGWAASGASRAG